MEEIRKEIPWLPKWKYFVSNLGRIKSRRWIMKFEYNHYWHVRIKLYWKWWKNDVRHYQVHRIVYCVFNNLDYNFWLVNDISKCYWLVLHKDNNPLNNRLDNLYMWTQKDNMGQCSSEWRIKNLSGFWRGIQKKLSINTVKTIKFLLSIGKSWAEISEILWIPRTTIYNIKNWYTRKHVSL